eukprot:CAMPEP_0201713694 /NCGR_PEP_ID=MMETSP0593-20130828/444_1 /ASSEMBLY_ACC=CAM_ASM_000672 /TAXON_ID=267983 /ORGANISM="Skeletonema japonicum, Strain CCMP2506" /LENGTH=148 /DNA_ID=CAMNT_0048202871 /DNA_START=76 /DNA_END=522 /DNA_ORIENTATION=+
MTEQNGNSDDHNPTRRRPARRNRPNGGGTLASSFKQFVHKSSTAELQEFSTQLSSALNSVSLNEDPATTNVSSDGEENNNKLRASQRRPSEGEFYAPQPTSRRNSKAGEQLVASMKQTAAELLAELGDLSDDDDDGEINVRGLDTCKE